MAFPLIPVMAALGLASVASQVAGGVKQQRFQERQARDQKAASRRAAIERAMGGTSFRRTPSEVTPPDMSNYAAFSGLTNLGSNLLMQKYGNEAGL